MDKLADWKIKCPEQFIGLDEIISSFTPDEIKKISAFIYEYETTCIDPSTQYMLIKQQHTTDKLACLNLFNGIYNIKQENKINGVLPKIDSLVKSYWNESRPRYYYFELKLKGIKNKFEVCGCEPY